MPTWKTVSKHSCVCRFYSVQINADMNNLIVKFSEHWHDAWARRKLGNGWKYGEPYNWHERIHPRLRPYNKLTEYVSLS